MSSPVIWILVPAGISLLLTLIRRWDRLVIVLAAGLGAVLAILAWKLPTTTVIDLGPISLEITETLEFLGRRFTLTAAERPELILIYGAYAFWALGALAARPGRLFAPFGLAVAALMTAALAVEPFLYAALLIQMAALVCTPILAKPGRSTGRGVLRFLTFQTLGMPLVLLTGWLLEGTSAQAEGQNLATGAALLLAMGFIFLLAVFPFHSWIPMLAEEAHPYAAAFVFFMLPGIITLFGLGLLARYPWMQAIAGLYSFTRTAGMLMVLTGGLWAAFQRHLGRVVGFAALVDIGTSLILVGLMPVGMAVNEQVRTVFLPLLAARGLALGLWTLALSLIRAQTGGLSHSNSEGIGRKLPLAAGAVILANLSISGFPLLAGFPSRLTVVQLSAANRPVLGILFMIGILGLLAAGLRSLAALVMGPEDSQFELKEPMIYRFFLAAGAAALIAAGLLAL